MGAITRSIANNITTSGVFTSSAIANSSVTGITVLANAPADGITLISSQTASNSASISFTSGLTSTYKAYKFVFVNTRPVTNNIALQFNFSTDGGSNYNVTKTSSTFGAYQNETGSSTSLSYSINDDLAQSTGFQNIDVHAPTADDRNLSGSLILFNPSSTTYVKHFITNTNHGHRGASYFSINSFVAGYGNTTSAINAVQFKMSSGNISVGTIYLYGIK
jgi:hypothetical protein